jgi:serine protease inhibitor
VEAETKGEIADLIDRVPRDAVLYLINALHFDGKWTQPFPKDRTREGAFRLASGGEVKVPMMNRTGPLGHFEDPEGAQGVRIPYGEGRWNMIVILPPPGVPVREFAAKVDRELWSGWLGRLEADRTVDVSLPRWSQEFKADLAGALERMGMGIAFGPGADFGAMSAAGGLQISRVLHQTKLEVDEEGTIGAAATAVEMTRSMPPRFEADRPFLFAVRDSKSGLLLFVGLVENPAP